MFRRATLLLLVLGLLTAGLFPARAELSNEARYTSAQHELARYFNGENTKSLDALCTDFESLGMYQQSTAFLFYTSILRDVSTDQFSQIDMYLILLRMDPDFCTMLQDSEFPSVDEVEAYAMGRKAEAAQDMQKAVAHYQQCGAILDSMLRVQTILMSPSAITLAPLPTLTPTPKPTPTPAPSPTPHPNRSASTGMQITSVTSNADGTLTVRWYDPTQCNDYLVFMWQQLSDDYLEDRKAENRFYWTVTSQTCMATLTHFVPSLPHWIVVMDAQGNEAVYSYRPSLPEMFTQFSVQPSLSLYTVDQSSNRTYEARLTIDQLKNNALSCGVSLTLKYTNPGPRQDCRLSLMLTSPDGITNYYCAWAPLTLESGMNRKHTLENTLDWYFNAFLNSYAGCQPGTYVMTVYLDGQYIDQLEFQLIGDFPVSPRILTIGDYTFATFDRETGIIQRYTGADAGPSVPHHLGGYVVTEIGVNAFASNPRLVTLTLPNTLTHIRGEAFYGCKALTTVTIPQDVTTIESYAFAYCPNLRSVTIPSSVSFIGNNAFKACPMLVLQVSSGSYAEQYARSNGIPCQTSGNSDYIFPDSNTRKLTRSEIEAWNYESLGYAFNEIFARHGYRFNPGSHYDSYFRSKAWYVPNASENNQLTVYPRMSDIDWYNYNLIKEVRNTKKDNDSGRSLWDR